MKKNNEIELYGKVAKMPKNLKASEAYNELQKIKIDSKIDLDEITPKFYRILKQFELLVLNLKGYKQ